MIAATVTAPARCCDLCGAGLREDEAALCGNCRRPGPPPTPEDLISLTAGDVARICNVAPRTACKWCDRGYLDHERLPNTATGRPGDRRVSLASLRRFLESRDMELSLKRLEAWKAAQ